MIRTPPCSTRTDPLFPATTLLRSLGDHVEDDDDERACRPAHLDARTAQRRNEEPGDDGRDQSLVRGRAARDRQSHGEGEGDDRGRQPRNAVPPQRSEEHTSELQSLMRISYAVFCLKTKTTHTRT